MSNMSYCRFRNTVRDLRDCQQALSEMGDVQKELSEEEFAAAKRLLRVCRDLADDFTDEETGEVNL